MATDIPTHFHPGHWANVPEGDELLSAMRRAHGAARQMLETARDVARLRKGNPAQTTVQQMRSIVKHVDSKRPAALTELDRVLKRARETVTAMEGALYAPLHKAGSWAYAGETRAHVRALSDPEQRYAFVRDALKRDDLAAAGAVLSAPGYLSGLSDTDVAMLMNEYQRTRHAEELKYMAEVNSKVQLLEKAGQALIAETEKMVDRTALKSAAEYEARIAELEA